MKRRLEDHLRDYLARLPDFDDVKAEDRPLLLALDYANVHQALAFLVSWPALDRAASWWSRDVSSSTGIATSC